ncbi:nose resistant to fluoxetine protein 6 [Biomphalaria pfeifferi]|uniref:Nose resistant to fluoxetine protein 6 n=1 Tax=Biomphalaria pfeifferi TaxID=112525 RepID=A0AAD8F6Q5_BIOPF|nr:nose resistant to fluoxetine protein 6 [Biomphalaria pfeifferi]
MTIYSEQLSTLTSHSAVLQYTSIENKEIFADAFCFGKDKDNINMPSRSILKIIFTLALSVFMNKLVFCKADDTILFPDSDTYPGTFTRLNHIPQNHGHSNYQEILKMYYSLFSDKELFGKAGIIRSSILGISAGSRNFFDELSVASEINDTDIEEALSSKRSQRPGNPFVSSSQNNCFVDVQRLFKEVKENEWTWPCE